MSDETTTNDVLNDLNKVERITIDHTLDRQASLGRLPAIDFRDRRFLAKPPEANQINVSMKHWHTGNVLDQGESPQCVAFAWEQYLESGPVTNKPYETPDQLYHEAQKVDEFPGEDYDGTSVRAGAKVIAAAGLLGNYVWAFDLSTATRSLLTQGPLVMGTNWDNAMFEPFTYKGTTFIKRGGGNAGGHAYVVFGVNLKRPCFCGDLGAVEMINSWGRSWADNGRAWICLKEFSTLISENGEACMATEIKFRPIAS